jgi:hypothetical protein
MKLWEDWRNLIESGKVTGWSEPEWHEDLAEVQQEYSSGFTYSCFCGRQSKLYLSTGHVKKRGKYKAMWVPAKGGIYKMPL